MSLRKILSTAFLLSALSAWSPTAAGACTEVAESTFVNGEVRVTYVEECPGDDSAATQTTTTAQLDPPRDSQLDRVCVRRAIELNIDIFDFCDIPQDEEAQVEVTPDLVAAALRRVPVPGSELVVQPPGGVTLVNFETNFYTETDTFEHALSLLGQRVELTLTPASYTWRFGDGEVQQGASPGSAYPALDVTHVYAAKSTMRPSVDTTWEATYRLNGGPSQAVPGSVTIPGDPIALEVITARPRLVG